MSETTFEDWMNAGTTDEGSPWDRAPSRYAERSGLLCPRCGAPLSLRSDASHPCDPHQEEGSLHG